MKPSRQALGGGGKEGRFAPLPSPASTSYPTLLSYLLGGSHRTQKYIKALEPATFPPHLLPRSSPCTGIIYPTTVSHHAGIDPSLHWNRLSTSWATSRSTSTASTRQRHGPQQARWWRYTKRMRSSASSGAQRCCLVSAGKSVILRTIRRAAMSRGRGMGHYVHIRAGCAPYAHCGITGFGRRDG